MWRDINHSTHVILLLFTRLPAEFESIFMCATKKMFQKYSACCTTVQDYTANVCDWVMQHDSASYVILFYSLLRSLPFSIPSSYFSGTLTCSSLSSLWMLQYYWDNLHEKDNNTIKSRLVTKKETKVVKLLPELCHEVLTGSAVLHFPQLSKG